MIYEIEHVAHRLIMAVKTLVSGHIGLHACASAHQILMQTQN